MESIVLGTLAAHYRQRRAGRTGQASRKVSLDYEDLLSEASSADGEARIIAERELEEARNDGILEIESHPRSGLKLKIRLLDEAGLFARIQEVAPSDERAQLAADFQEAATDDVPAEYEEGWIRFCSRMAEAAEAGTSIHPWQRSDNARYLLSLLPSILRWQDDTPIRFASAHLCGDSKRLEQLQSKLEDALEEISGGKIACLADVGIIGNERSILIHGPLELVFAEDALDLGLLHAPARIDHRDIKRGKLQTSASRCVTIENGAMLHQLSKGNAGILYASSGSEGGFAHSAIVSFLNALPESVSISHFGDSDPKGFEILSDLRKRVAREIASAGMTYRPQAESPKLEARDKKTIDALLQRGRLTKEEKASLQQMLEAGRKGRFEQESMTSAELPTWDL